MLPVAWFWGSLSRQKPWTHLPGMTVTASTPATIDSRGALSTTPTWGRREGGVGGTKMRNGREPRGDRRSQAAQSDPR